MATPRISARLAHPARALALLGLLGLSGGVQAAEEVTLGYTEIEWTYLTLEEESGVIDLSGYEMRGIEPEEIDDRATGDDTSQAGIEPEEIDDKTTGDDTAEAGIEPEEIDILEYIPLDGSTEGAKPKEAFFVRCDRTTMTQMSVEDLGGEERLAVKVNPEPIYLPHMPLSGYFMDARGGKTLGQSTGTLVIIPREGTLSEGVDENGRPNGEVELSLTYEGVEVFADDPTFVADSLGMPSEITFPKGSHVYSNITLKRGIY